MSMSANFHGMNSAEICRGDTARWLWIRNEKGDHVAIFVKSDDDLRLIADACVKVLPVADHKAPFSSYPEDRATLLDLARKCEQSDDSDAIKLGDLVRAILEDEAVGLGLAA